jgi:type II secretory pathway pseudopilin PulG
MDMCRAVHTDEEGIGFVESLVAIAVGGIACIALFGVALTVIREANYNEMRDAMNTYAIEGIEQVRVQASTAYQSVPQCSASDPSAVVEAYLDNGTAVKLLNTQDLCSDAGDEAGTCERLTMPKGSTNIFYREVKLTGAGDDPIDESGNCTKMRVEVSVGLLVNAGESDPPRGNLPERKIVGYISR